MNATKSVLYHLQQVWIKTNNNNSSKLFDITMEEKHGAEICKLVGLYILNGIKSKLNVIKVGIYRDEGLIAIDKYSSGPHITEIKNKVHEYANEIGIEIVLENPVYKINYLDLNLDSRNETFHPYRKPNK